VFSYWPAAFFTEHVFDADAETISYVLEHVTPWWVIEIAVIADSPLPHP
jgi:hypothetical protein